MDAPPWQNEVLSLTELKDAGNELFRRGDVASAVEAYEQGIETLAGRSSLPPQLETVLCLLHSNACAAELKVSDWASACHHARAGLQLSVALQDGALVSKLYTRWREALEGRVAAGETVAKSELAEAIYIEQSGWDSRLVRACRSTSGTPLSTSSRTRRLLKRA